MQLLNQYNKDFHNIMMNLIIVKIWIVETALHKVSALIVSSA